MVYSARADSELLVRCMRAGAREFLTEPCLPSTIGEALVRASVRRDEVRRQKKATGKLLVFAGAKGGSGVTRLRAISRWRWPKQSGSKVALLDLDLQLGDAALTLGVATKFTALDALENTNRLDSDFLSVLMAKHDSGLAVLAAPGYAFLRFNLRRTAWRNCFAWCAKISPTSWWMPVRTRSNCTRPFRNGDHSVPGHSGERRGAAKFEPIYIPIFQRRRDGEKLEIVLNRFVARNLEIDEAAITKALTRPAKWKIPNDLCSRPAGAEHGSADGVGEKPDRARVCGDGKWRPPAGHR